MKLIDLVESDDSRAISTEDMEMVFKRVEPKELYKEDIADIANELAEDSEFGRNKASAEFLLNRMHVLIHGIAPHGETQNRAEKMFNASRPLIDFINKKGYDVDGNLEKARIELANRLVKVKRPEALKRVAEYFKNIKEKITKEEADVFRKNKENIVKDIMNGIEPAEAFKKVVH